MVGIRSNISEDQRTLADTVTIEGVGLHTGLPARLTMKPAQVDTGITFYRTDVSRQHRRVPARWDCVSDTMLCTKLTNAHDVNIGTVEHLMAAFFACDLDNVEIDIDGPEIPIVDGSCEPFVSAIEKIGTVKQEKPRKIIEILKTVRVADSPSRWVVLQPSDRLSMDCRFEFTGRADLPAQEYQFNGSLKKFKQDIVLARTFGFLQDIEKLWEMGLAKGGSLENAILIDNSRIVNDGGLRFTNECVRHKVLDAMGDLLLAGYRIQGKLIGRQSGHGLMNRLLRALFADQTAWRFKPPAETSDQVAVFLSQPKEIRVSTSC